MSMSSFSASSSASPDASFSFRSTTSSCRRGDLRWGAKRQEKQHVDKHSNYARVWTASYTRGVSPICDPSTNHSVLLIQCQFQLSACLVVSFWCPKCLQQPLPHHHQYYVNTCYIYIYIYIYLFIYLSVIWDFSWLITLRQPVLSQRGKNWLNLPSMAPHNLWTPRRKGEVQP